MVENEAVKEVELSEEESDKEIHLMEFEDEVWRKCVKESCLCLEELLVVIKSQIMRNNMRTYFTLDVPSRPVCSLIVDGYANLASTTVTEKLQLTVEPYLHPYSIQWLHKGKELQVSSHCLVAFSIGKSYQDELLCDVLPMDSCHVLLERP